MKEVLVSIAVMNFYILELFFSAIFLYTCYNSIKKYIDSMVAIAIQESEISEVEYPSVRNSFKKYVLREKSNHSKSLLLIFKLLSTCYKYFEIYISVCMDNVYKTSIDQVLFQNDSITVDDLENLVKANIWKKNETFFFVNYPSANVGGFPCMTTKERVHYLHLFIASVD